MSNPTWPISLPQSLPINAPEVPEDGRIRTAMDYGPPKVRRRTTAVIRTFSCPPDKFILSEAQRAALEYFFHTTLAGGTLEFDWEDPWPDAGTLTFRVQNVPTYTPIYPGSNRLFETSLVLEQLP